MNRCRLCKHDKLEPVIDLGDMPIAHEFSSTHEQASTRLKYPMQLVACKQCGMGQLAQVIDPNILYSNYNFCFSSWKAQPHIEDECRKLAQYLTSGTIVEVGCNDGLFLEALEATGDYHCIGVEPNAVSSGVAAEKGFEVINSFFEEAVDNELKHKKVDAVFARQVMEHIPDVEKFLISINQLLDVGGLVGIEVPNTEIALKTGDISCLWEEHVNYFTPSCLALAIEHAGFDILESCSYLFSGEALFILARKRVGLKSLSWKGEPDFSLYRDFNQQVAVYRQLIKEKLTYYKTQNYGIALYGSGCRASTILHGLKLEKFIDFIVDDQVEKQGLYMSATQLSVQSLSSLDNNNKYIFILAVNHENDAKVSARILEQNFSGVGIVSAHSPVNIIEEIQRL